MRKKLIAWLLVALWLFNFPTASINAAEGGFTDIGNHWAKELIMKFTEQGTINGYPDGTFKPDGYLSRAEAVILLNNFFNIAESGYPSFSDVTPDDAWFYFHVGAAEEKEYISGYTDNTFRPGSNLTRLEAFVMIYNLLGKPEHESIYALTRFSDTHLIPSDKPIYQQVVAYMADKGIINAYPDNSLRVNDFITRAEMLSLLNKVSDMITNSNYLIPEAEENPDAIPEEIKTPEPTPELEPTPEPELEPTPEPATMPESETNKNKWPAPLPPGSTWRSSPGSLETYWHTNEASLKTNSYISAKNPGSNMRSGSPSFKGMNTDIDAETHVHRGAQPNTEAGADKGIEKSPPIFRDNQPNVETITDTDIVSSGEGIIPKDLFTLENGSINISENSIVISGSDKAYLNREYTLPKGTVLELPDSILILKADLNITDENDLIGNRGSGIVEDGGFLNFGPISILQSLRSSITRGLNITKDTYYYDAKSGKWKALK